MRVNGKFHRETWMSQKGRDELNKLLLDDYMSKKNHKIFIQFVTYCYNLFIVYLIIMSNL